MRKLLMGSLIFSMSIPISAFQMLRPYDPIIVPGADLSAHFNAPLTDLFLFAFDKGQWREIAFQIDEKGPDDSYFTPDDGLLDANDELVFQPQDGAGLAAIHQWLDDCGAMIATRTEIRITDPLTGAATTVYLYQSDTLIPSPAPDLVFYDQASDSVSGAGYQVGFDGQQHIWDTLFFFDGPTTTADLMDREKFRIQGTVPIFGGFTLTEDDPVPTGLLVKAGPVRIIRRAETEITLFGQTLNAPFERHYFRNTMGTPAGGAIQIPPAITINNVRASIDFSDQAIGASVTDQNNANLTVDGVPDPNVQTLITPVQQAGYWIRFHLLGFSLINAGKFDNIAPEVRFYYHDDINGGTADGTTDTGDLMSFGDAGVRFVSPSAPEISIAFSTYFDIEDLLDGSDAAAYLNNPLQTALSEQDFADAYLVLLSLWGATGPNAPDIRTLVRHITKFGPPIEIDR